MKAEGRKFPGGRKLGSKVIKGGKQTVVVQLPRQYRHMSQALAQATTISIGTVGSGNTLEWHTEKRGFLEQEKLALEWVGAQSGAAVMQQVAAGSLNLGTTGLAARC